MAQYAWKGKSRGGAVQEGVLVAENKEAVISMLRKQQIIVTAVTEKGKEIALPKLGGGVPQKEIAIFTRQFSVMIDAGLPLVQCLEILGTQQVNRVFQKVLFQVRQDVESGSTLADALRKHPKVFDELFCNMVAAGEAGGILDTILQRLSEHIEKAVKLKASVKKAMIYPVAVITIAIGVIWVILTFVIPVFAALFQNLGGGAALPLPTRIVIGLSNFMQRFSLFIAAGAAAGYWFGFRPYYATESGKRQIDRLMLRLPILGILLRKIAVARFCRTLGTMISSGVPILDALTITGKTAGNMVVQDAIMKTRASIEAGKTISEPLRETEVFPPMVTQMIGVGEQTGALDTMLAKIADFYDQEVDDAVAGLLTLLEPIMISFLGVMIGGIVIAMYMPIFSLISLMP
ncbi:MAG TPA: type II secretion system F family protein [Candidatus Polarisedimenticolia bacterium]|nr:type II secretion system F family protein [Candidatus Polarisedimenticolia bacterium]